MASLHLGVSLLSFASFRLLSISCFLGQNQVLQQAGDEEDLRHQLMSIPDVGVPPTSRYERSGPFQTTSARNNNHIGVGVPLASSEEEDFPPPKPVEDLTETGVSFDAYVADVHVKELKMATAVAEPLPEEDRGGRACSKRNMMIAK